MQAMGGQKNASSDPDGVSRRHQSQHQHRSPHGTELHWRRGWADTKLVYR